MKTALFTMFVFFLVVLVHEFGHFIVAKLSGVKVHEFAIGMGPKFFKVKKGETDYTLRMLPIGGYVKMEGEDEESNDDRSFGNKSIRARIAIVSAGAIMNFILALIIFIIHAYAVGTYTNTNVLGSVIDKMPAQEMGVKKGDKIVSINGQETRTWEDIVSQIDNSTDDNINVEVIRGGDQKEFSLIAKTNQNDGSFMIGITPSVEKNFASAIKVGFERFTLIIKEMLLFIPRILQGNISKDEVSGPVGIIYAVGDASQYGFMTVLFFAGIISINLGVFNLLPIPALDGSRIVFLLIELLRGKPIDSNKEGLVHLIGFMLLISLMIFVAYNDLVKFNILSKITNMFG